MIITFISRYPCAAIKPAVISNESPEEKNPTSKPVSAKIIIISTVRPPHFTNSSRLPNF
ncbi:MAG: hypothetical protein R2942_12730 [Ignavibacteria bacterium]